MKIIHVIHSIDDHASGTTTAVYGMCQSQSAAGANINLFTLNWELLYPEEENFSIKRFPFTCKPKKLGISNEMYRNLSDETKNNNKPVIIHSHTIWTMQSYYPYIIRRKNPSCRYILSPHGTLSKYSLSIGSKLKPLYWHLLQKPALDAADCIHATSESEYEDIRKLGIKSPIAIIPNGSHMPEFSMKSSEDSRSILYLGRIHPEKGLESLLSAWKMASVSLADWKLKIVGPDPVGYKNKLELIVKNYGLKNVTFENALFGEDKLKLFEKTEILILPSPSENFGMVVVEALSSGVPVITTSGTPWKELQTRNLGWYCDCDVVSLANALELAVKVDVAKRREMGVRGRLWVESNFSFGNVTDKMISIYKWLIEEGPIPSCIELK